MKRIILTVDVELWTMRGSFEQDIETPMNKLLDWTAKEGLPVTLFTSLSNKGLGGHSQEEYLKILQEALLRWSKNPLVEFGVHSHCLNLPLSFPTLQDGLDRYDHGELDEIIGWQKQVLTQLTGQDIYSHRSGGYRLPKEGLSYLSSILTKHKIYIDSSDISTQHSKQVKLNGLIEIPPATNTRLSSHRKVWAPDNMGFDEMVKFYEDITNETDILVMNWHSFAMMPALLDPHSRLKQFWFSMPSVSQRALRPFINVGKKAWRKLPSDRGASSADESASFLVLRTIIDYLRSKDCEFTTFKVCLK